MQPYAYTNGPQPSYYPQPEQQYPTAPVQYLQPQGQVQQVLQAYPSANHPANTAATIIAQPAVISSAALRFSEYPMQITCPYCQARVVTQCNYETGWVAWLVCFILFWFIGLFAFIAFCIDGFKDVRHTCSNCQREVGIYRRS